MIKMRKKRSSNKHYEDASTASNTVSSSKRKNGSNSGWSKIFLLKNSKNFKNDKQLLIEKEVGRAELLSPKYSHRGDSSSFSCDRDEDDEIDYSDKYFHRKGRADTGVLKKEKNNTWESAWQVEEKPINKQVSASKRNNYFSPVNPQNPFLAPIPKEKESIKISKSKRSNFRSNLNPQSSPQDQIHTQASREKNNPQQHLNVLKQLSHQHLQDEIHKLAHVSLGDDLTVSTFSQFRSVAHTTANSSKTDESKSVDFNSYPPEHLQIRERKAQHLLAVKSALDRPFGRSGLPPSVKRCHVEIAPPEWDAEVSRWKYMICIRDDHPLSVLSDGWKNQSSNIIAKISRTLQDFAWLEHQLLQDYDGGLVLPSLTLSLNPFLVNQKPKNSPNIPSLDFNLLDNAMDKNEKVNEKLLGYWLSDILNSVRGQGELILKSSPDLLLIETMETFLYRNIDDPVISKESMTVTVSVDSMSATENSQRNKSGLGVSSSTSLSSTSRSSRLDSVIRIANQEGCNTFPSWMDESYWKQKNDENGVSSAINHLFWKPLSCFTMSTMESNDLNNNANSIPMEMISCSSRSKVEIPALASANSRDWSAKASKNKRKFPSFSSNAIQSDLIEMQNAIFTSYRVLSSSTLSNLRSYLDKEMMFQSIWRRFAISLSNLYNFEKDVERCQLIGYSNPESKIDKSAQFFDDQLRILCGHKHDRSYFALRLVGGMLNTYLSDLFSVKISLEAYARKISKIAQDDVYPHTNKIEMEKKLLTNEQLLQTNLYSFFHSTHLRMSRMSWKFLNMELGQVKSLLICIKSIQRSVEEKAVDTQTENEHEEENAGYDKMELDIVNRIIDLSLNDLEIGDQKQRHQILSMVNLGRWNSDLALAILSCAGVQDAEISVEETTKDLRLARKYAIGLRNCLQRSKDAMTALKNAVEEDSNELHKKAFWSSLCMVLSGCWGVSASSTRSDHNEDPALTALLHHGLQTPDTAGWLDGAILSDNDTMIESLTEVRSMSLINSRGQCGKLLMSSYQKHRISSTLNLLGEMNRLLHNYEERIESIESYVYMHCVGIQLEKHFSKCRKEALAAWEKKTDLTTAINIAQRKRLPVLVQELKSKLEAVSHPTVSHTTVKQTKEKHLTCKQLKTELQVLAMNRFQQLKSYSTKRIRHIVQAWTTFEEDMATEETHVLKMLLREIESYISGEDLERDGGAHLFASADSDFQSGKNDVIR